MSHSVLIFVSNASQLNKLVYYIITIKNNEYSQRNNHFSKWCVSKVFQYIKQQIPVSVNLVLNSYLLSFELFREITCHYPF